MSPSPNPIRRSSRLHSRVALNVRHTDDEQERNSGTTNTRKVSTTTHHNSTPPSIQMTGPRVIYTHDHMAIWRAKKAPIVPNTKGLIESTRPGPGYYRQPPPEAYLIVRAHRRPADGWDEDWSKKGDGWTYQLSTISTMENGGLILKLEVKDQNGKIVPPDTRLASMILQYRISSSSPDLVGIVTAQISAIGDGKFIGFHLGNVPSLGSGVVVDVRLYDLGSCMSSPEKGCTSIAGLRIS